MKKNECNVVRDLMPLVLDRVASDESRALVEEHMDSCEECRKQYEEMKADMPEETRAEYEEEQRTIVEALRKVKRQQKKRRIRKIALLVAICMLAVFGSGMLLSWLNSGDWPVDNKLYTLALSQLKDGRIVITEDLQFHANSHGMTHIYTEEDGKNILYWYCVSAPLQYVHDGKVIGKSGWAAMDSLDRPDELRQGTPKDYITIWKKGDAVPAASDEMETYFALEDQVFGKNDVPSVEEGLWARMDKLRDTVPEWQ